MRMNFKNYKISYSCYPRVNHAHKHVKQLSDRYNDLKSKGTLKKYLLPPADTTCRINNDKPEFELCLQTSDKGSVVEIEDVLQRKDKFHYTGLIEYRTIEEFVRHKECLKESYVVLVTKENVKEINILQSKNVDTIIITDSIEESMEDTEYLKDIRSVHVSLKENVSDKVCKIMEQNVFKAFEMKNKCEILNKCLSEHRKQNASQEQSQNFIVKGNASQIREGRKECLSESVKCNEVVAKKEGTPNSRCVLNSDSVHTTPSPKKRPWSADKVCLNGNIDVWRQHGRLNGRATTTEIYSRLETEPSQPCISKKPRTNENVSLETENASRSVEKSMFSIDVRNVTLNEHVDRIERLLDEMIGMFARSRVPQNEKPKPDENFDGIVSDVLKQDLRLICPSVRGCGYRCCTFVVFVDDESDPETFKPEIGRILNKHNISKFTVVSSSVKELSSCNVGSEVEATFGDGTVKYGTLGGFGLASSDGGNNTICLVSRHVVADVNGNPASTLKVLNDKNATDASIMIDKSIREHRETVLDIAAASFESDESQFDTKYKTSEENAAEGKLSEYSLEELRGLPVHICGSKTPMGYGTITMPNVEAVQDSSMDDFIIIEDRDNAAKEKKPFCADGDSGSIVCTDDQENPENVRLVSMVMGENTDKPGFYYSLNLEEGIKQVKEETKSNIQLL
ncbi:uncharacterized protein LOC123548353 [Mercenaria mercenaria]|uniref:uncharacterized protein LOC123548353 n=1 Tax=Mercenaria mercenaria TaxID=6596 RepID=UPI00234F9D8C|nr:uncharacterized protein LOC123548353 [Mercenaria mercenaria]